MSLTVYLSKERTQSCTPTVLTLSGHDSYHLCGQSLRGLVPEGVTKKQREKAVQGAPLMAFDESLIDHLDAATDHTIEADKRREYQAHSMDAGASGCRGSARGTACRRARG